MNEDEARATHRVIHLISSLDDGGAEGVLFRLGVVDSASILSVICLKGDGKYAPLLRQAGVNVICLNMSSLLAFFRGSSFLFFYFRKNRSAVLQTWMYHADLLGGVLARISGLQKVFWGIRQSTFERASFKRSTFLTAKICSYVSSFVPKLIICCAHRAAIEHAKLGYCKEKMYVIHNGFDTDKFCIDIESRESYRKSFSPYDSDLLGFVARFDPYKDYFNFLSALRILKSRGIEFKAVFAGKGMDSLNSELMDKIKQLDLEKDVVLLGQRSDIPCIMNCIDVFVLSSMSEAFPNVIAEAMLCGTPAVTTDVGDAANIVGDTGWIVPPKDSLALANALEEAITARKNRSSWQIRRLSARERIQREFSLNSMTGKFHSVWFE